MKRHQKTFSVEIKKSRAQGPRQHLPPRRLFATSPAEPSALIETAAPQAVAEPVVAPRVLPSIVAPVPTRSEPVEPVRRKRALRPKADATQIELDWPADAAGEEGEESSGTPRPEAGRPTDVAPNAQDSATPVTAVRLHDVDKSEARAGARRKKPSESVEPVEESQPGARTKPGSSADPIPSMGTATAAKAIPGKRNRLQAAARLPRSERWKRRLHPAVW